MHYTASGTILVGRFCKISGVGTVAQQSTAGALVIGIAQDGGRYAPIPSNTADPVEAAQSGEQVQVWSGMVDGQWPLLQLGSGGATVGDDLKSDTAGKGVVSSTAGDFIGAIALETGSAGEYIRVMPVLYQAYN